MTNRKQNHALHSHFWLTIFIISLFLIGISCSTEKYHYFSKETKKSITKKIGSPQINHHYDRSIINSLNIEG